jgi:MFS family permease
MYAPDLSYNAWLGLFLLLGFFTSTQIISYPLIAESNANALIGSSTGLAAVIIMSGGAWGQPLFGRLLDLHWNGVKVNDLPIYTLANYHFAWMLLPIMFVVALILAVMIRETSCKVYKGD